MLANVGGARSLWAASCRNAAVEIPEGTLMPMSLSFFRSCGRVSRDGWLHETRGGCRCCTIDRVVYFDFLFVLTIAVWFNMLLRTIKESENEMRYCNYRWSSKALIRDHELPLVPSHQQVFLSSCNSWDRVNVKCWKRVQQSNKFRRIDLFEEAFWRPSSVTNSAQLVKIYQFIYNTQGSEYSFY